jgi:uncharacterized OB-fold protein
MSDRSTPIRDKETGTELITIPITMDIEFQYPAGKYFSHFFKMMKDGQKLMAVRCGACGQVLIPPRPVCGDCFEPMTEWVEVGPRGTVTGFTSIYFSFYDANLGKNRPVPFGSALIQLDGADNDINHFLEESDVNKMHIGMRVEPVFRENREGTIGDIIFFRTIEDGD